MWLLLNKPRFRTQHRSDHQNQKNLLKIMRLRLEQCENTVVLEMGQKWGWDGEQGRGKELG
jgi:hypothetical protein